MSDFQKIFRWEKWIVEVFQIFINCDLILLNNKVKNNYLWCIGSA